MKMITTLVCIIATSAIATAQTANTTTTTTTNTSVAKAKKKKKTKAPIEIKTVDTPVEKTTSVTTPTEVAPAVGSSTAAVPAAAPVKDFTGYILSDTSADQSNTHGTENIDSITMIGGSYQLAAGTKLGISQAFETVSHAAFGNKQNEAIDQNNFRPLYVEPGINTTLTNFLGSDTTKFDFKTRFYNDNALSYKVGGGAAINRHYNISTNSNIAFNPHFSGSLYNEARIYEMRDQSAAATRISFLPSLGYAINDSISFYQIVGYMINTRDGETLTNKRERMYLETGLNYSPAAIKGLGINLLTYQDKMIVSKLDTEKVSGFSLYDVNNNNDGTSSNDSMVYEAIVNYSF